MGNLVSSSLAFMMTLVLLIIYSFFDIQERKVPNRVILVGGIVGAVMSIISGHFYENLLLHLFALAFTIPISYLLFKLGTVGGADAKALISVAITSPGFEFLLSLNPLVEAIIAAGIELVVMLSLGYFWYYLINKHNNDALSPPLIPFLLVGYLIVAGFYTVILAF